MKKKLLFPLALILSTAIFACGEQQATTSTLGPTPIDPSVATTTTTPQPTIPSATPTTPVEEEYTIRVTAPTGVEYSLSKNKAKKGETVTLTITSLASGYTIKKVTLNNSEITGSNNVYTFTMPNRSASINIEVNVDGDVTLVGEIAANLILNEETGIYEARNIKIESPKKEVYFSYQIKKDGQSVILDSTDLDETKCFADVTFAYGSGIKEELEIASGATYDFFYDPNAQYPCYVQRVSVDVLPQDVNSLYTLFDGAMRSDTTCHETGLTGIDYSVLDTQSSSPLKLNYTYREYENNVTYANIVDVLTDKQYHVYKEYDETNKLYTVVDTYTKALGNDDIFRLEYNNHGAHSAQLDVVETDSDNNTRFELSKRKALRNLNNPAHHGYYLERDFMDSYRVGYTADDMTSSSVNISSTQQADGFKTVIDSYIEYNVNDGAYVSDRHEAYKFNVEIDFNKAGAVKALTYEKVKFTKTEWDFNSHTPNVGQEGTIVKKVTMKGYYDSLTSGKPSFDKSKYFISSIDSLQFYNEKTNAPIDGKSYVHYMDKIRLTKASENDTLSNLKEIKYTPSTALDLWQYSPTKSSDENIIAKLSTNRYDEMTACGIGSATVTFSNHTKSSGITKDVTINVTATQKFHSMYLNTGGDPVTTANSANITAGQIGRFQIGVTPSTAPVVFDAVVEPSGAQYLSIVSTTGGYLVLDASGAKDITEPVTVRVKCTSDWYDPAVTNKYTMFSFTIIPADVSPVGTWKMVGSTETNYVNLTFTDNDYTGNSYLEGAKMGEIVDCIDGVVDTFKFYYVLNNGQLSARLYSVDIKSSTDFSKDPLDYAIDFYYEASTGRYGLALFECVYDEYYEDFMCYPIYGDVSSDGEINGYMPFEKVN